VVTSGRTMSSAHAIAISVRLTLSRRAAFMPASA
jgi:hypothetical protein